MAGSSWAGRAVVVMLLVTDLGTRGVVGGGRPGRLVTAVMPRLDQGPAYPRHGQEEEEWNQSRTAEKPEHHS
ncbi:MAG: hypothetical protein ACREMH_06340 [Gemmatimonadales bacterium]